MRKLSELLRICSEFNYYINPYHKHAFPGMCHAASYAYITKVITEEECNYVSLQCVQLVDELHPVHSYLHSALSDNLGIPREESDLFIPLIYDAWITKLESEGK